MSGCGSGGEGGRTPLPATGYRRSPYLEGLGYGIRCGPRATTLMVPALSGVALPGA